MVVSLPPIGLADEAATARFGEDLAAALKAGDVLALKGELGAGKTTLARAAIRALAGDDMLDVPSPTFTLQQSYEARFPVHHFDLYRLSDPQEIEELGFFEAIAEGAALVEWPEKAGSLLPADAVTVELREAAGGGRLAFVSGPEGALARIARSLAARAFLNAAGAPCAVRRHLQGDASARVYETVTSPGAPTRILMDAPRRADGPPIRDGLPYSRIAHLAEDVAPFVAIAEALRQAGFHAPEIHAADLEGGFLLIEHLGADGVRDAAGEPIPERYLAAARLLAAMHDRDWPQEVTFDGGRYRIPDYDAGAMAIETDLLLDWYLPFATGGPAAPETVQRFHALWAAAFARAGEAERSLVLRDFHSPNLIWRDTAEGHGRIGLIDFQDALIGPAAYDVASLALDARVDISRELEGAIVDAYCAARASPAFDCAGFEATYAIMAAQRNSKILGNFVRLDRRDGKPHYLKHLPRIRDYLKRSLDSQTLAELRVFYEEAGLLAETGP